MTRRSIGAEDDHLVIARLAAQKRPLPEVYRGVQDVLRRRMPAEKKTVSWPSSSSTT